MQGLKQDIFPVCSFGRAENVFYQSADSLCPYDLTFHEILLLIKGHSAPLFPSHILDRDDWEELVVEIIATGAKPRVQVALGREWEELKDKILFANHLGWELDILVDRSLTTLVTPPELFKIAEWRWVACPLRFFNLKDMAASFETQESQKPVLWCFLEPRDEQTLLLNPDEVILAQKEMGAFSSLILVSSLNTHSGFYQSPSLETYQAQFVELGPHKKTRSLVAAKLKNFPQLFSLFIFLGSFFLSESPRPLMNKLPPIPFWKLGKIKWTLYAIFSRTRWAVGQVGWFLRSLTIRAFWKLVAVAQVTRNLIVTAYWKIHPLFGYVRMGFIRAYWSLRHAGSRIYWFAYPLPGFIRSRVQPKIMRVIYFVGWPVFKVYWFVKYQYETRVYPVVKGMLTDD